MKLLRRYRAWKSRRQYQKAINRVRQLQTSGNVTADQLNKFREAGIRMLEWGDQ